MMFSLRTSWHRRPNRLAELLESRRQSGYPIIDLTQSNPTEAGFPYPEKEILTSLSNPQSLQYHADPRGLLSARESVASYYRSKNVDVDRSNIFLTAGTSEAYSLIFKLLCNAGDGILVPRPSYPLFDYLAQIDDVALRYYRLQYNQGWHIDLESIRESILPTSRAIVLIHPHNPTGMFLKAIEYREIVNIARDHNLALIVDEVFSEYGFEKDPDRIVTTAGSGDALTFTLNGISKMIGLPQMKVGWIMACGEELLVKEASERLEILCDTFLSVNTPVQVALPILLDLCMPVCNAIRERVRSNDRSLRSLLRDSPCSLLSSEGGWSAILRLPRTKSDEEWAMDFLNIGNVLVHPGYFFDMEEESHVVVSLIVEESLFQRGIGGIEQCLANAG